MSVSSKVFPAKNILLSCATHADCAVFALSAALIMLSGCATSKTLSPEDESLLANTELVSVMPITQSAPLKTELMNAPVHGEISYSQFEADLASFKTLITTGYVLYDEMRQQGFNVDKAVQSIREKFSGHDIVDSRKFSDAIGDEIKPYICDTHFSVHLDRFHSIKFCEHKSVHYSDVFVKKSGEKFFVLDGAGLVANGIEYTGSEENLFCYPAKGKDVYRVGIFSEKRIRSADFLFGGKTFTLSVKSDTAIEPKLVFRFNSRTTQKSAYYSLSSFMFPGEDDRTRAAADVMLKKMKDAIAANAEKENVIVDLRSNNGGHMEISAMMSEGILFGLDFDASVYERDDIFFDEYITSPAQIDAAVSLENQYKSDKNYRGYMKELQEKRSDFEKRPRVERWREPYLSKLYQNGEQLPNNFRGNIYVLFDRNSASASELFYIYSLVDIDDTGRIKIIGENTMGCITTGGVLYYQLPYSGIGFASPMTCFSETLSHIPAWHGEGSGLFPDYWCTGSDLLETLVTATGDEELREVLSGVYYGLR